MKEESKELTEHIKQLEDLFGQSQLIKKEIKRHVTFSNFAGRIGGIRQQLQFIRHHVLPRTKEEKLKYFKHNKLALKLINRHIDEMEREIEESRLKAMEGEEEQWEIIEELREETLHNIEHIEAALETAEQERESENEIEETKDILLFEAEVAELADKTEMLIEEIELHGGAYEPIFEQIHHLHNELQFIRLHAYSRNHAFEPHEEHHADFLTHHFHGLQHINENLHELSHHWEHLIHQLHAENHHEDELKHIQEEIKHTIEQFNEKLEEIEENKLHYMQHPGAHIVPVRFNKK
jgi:DNA repair exonuclease SbcCD ATPase subunit